MLDKKEVLRYLGYRGQPLSKQLEQEIDLCMQHVESQADVRVIHATFPLLHQEGHLILANQIKLTGKAIYRHFKRSKRCTVIAVTLGITIDRLIRLAQYHDMTRAMILDACATAFVEYQCDLFNDHLIQEAAVEGIHLTSRFSPGYGDLPLELQPALLSLLDAERRIGLTVTDSLILLPRKSVTALIGWQEEKGERVYGCVGCTQQNCTYCRVNENYQDTKVFRSDGFENKESKDL